MVFVQLLPIAARTASSGVAAAPTIPAGTREVEIRLTSNQWPAVVDPTSYLDWTLEWSADGGLTWHHAAGARFPNGARGSLNGNMPGYTWQPYTADGVVAPIPTDLLARCLYTIVGSMRFGVEWELR